MSGVSLNRLPNEILLMVIPLLGDASLGALIQTSRRLHTLECELYLRNARQGNSTALQWAAVAGHSGTTRKALAYGADPNSSQQVFDQTGPVYVFRGAHSRFPTLEGFYGHTPLALAAANGNLEIASLLIEAGAVIAVDSPWGFRCPSLIAAIDTARLEMIKLLVTRGNIDINSIRRVENNDTLLNIAIKAKHAEDDESNVRVVRYLLAMMDYPNIVYDNYLPPLSTAIIHRRVKSFTVLLESSKVYHNQPTLDGNTPLMLAIEYRTDDQTIIDLLLRSEKIDFNAANSRGITPICQAARRGCKEVVQSLLAMPNVDPNRADARGMQPVAHALKSGFVSVVELFMASERVKIYGHALFTLACLRKSASVMTELLERNTIDKTTTGSDGGSWLHEAALYDFPEAATALIHKHRNHVNKRRYDGATPLLCAMLSRRGKVMPVLLRAGADVNIADVRGRTPLIVAVSIENVYLSEELLKHGSNVDAVLNTGDSALHLASRLGHGKLAQVLLKHGANPVLENSYGITPLHIASSTSGPIVHELLRAIPHFHPVLNTGQTPLHLACLAGNTAIAKTLVQHGADPMVRMANGITPLEIACRCSLEMVRMLLENGADPRQQNSQGVSYLRQSCARYASPRIVTLLLEHGLDPNTVELGTTGLLEACRHGAAKTIQTLLKHGADVNFVAAVNGTTALHEVCQHEHHISAAVLFDVVTTMVKKGAKVHARTSDNRTPLHIASQNIKLGAIRALLLAGADPLAEYVDTATSRRITPFHLVSRHAETEALTLLLDHVPQALMRDSFRLGWAPLHEAAAFGHPSTVSLLLSHGANAMALADNGQTALHRVFAQLPANHLLLELEDHFDFDLFLQHDLVQVITLLVKTGMVDINHRDSEGRTALGLIVHVPEAIHQLMVEYGAEL